MTTGLIMTEETRHYRPELLRDWKLGRLHRKWYKRDKTTFCRRDLENTKGQHRKGYHFGEWLMIRYYRRQGYQVLPPKYLHPTRERARRRAVEFLRKEAVDFLLQEMKFGGRLRKSPRPDLLVFKSNPRKFFFVEVKRDNDRLSAAQRRFFPMIEKKLGCEVRIVHLKPFR
jgi:hypothetical protein